MNREHCLQFCRKCKNNSFDPDKGIICNLTSDIANFTDTCPDFEHDGSPDEEGPGHGGNTPVFAELPEVILSRLRLHQDLSYAIIGGLLSAFVSAIIWAIITVSIKYQIGYMAIGVGLLVGFSVRFFGAGVDKVFGFIGAFFALLGCLLGNLLSQIGFIAQAEHLEYLDVILFLNLPLVIALLKESFGIMDLFFYSLAVYEGYKFAFRKMDEELLYKSEITTDDLKPAFAKLRLPLSFVCLIFFFVIFYTLKQSVNGYKTFYYASGAKLSEGAYENGKEEGKWIFYSEDGKVSSEGFYHHGKRDSVWTWYGDSNEIVSVGNYKHDIAHGFWANYIAGILVDSGHYASGRRSGAWAFYYDNGSLFQKGAYDRDAMEGEWEFYHENGNKSAVGNYSKGTATGNWKNWYNNGNLSQEIVYEDDESFKIINAWSTGGIQLVSDGNGILKNYTEDDFIQETGEIQNGKRVGLWISYYTNGNKKEEAVYNNGTYELRNYWKKDGTPLVVDGNGDYLSYYNEEEEIIFEKGKIENGGRTGKWSQYYYEDGSKLMDCYYTEGKLNGPYLTYHANGKVYREGTMKDNKREGVWNWYYEDGTLESTVNITSGKKEGKQLFYSTKGDVEREETYKNGEWVGDISF